MESIQFLNNLADGLKSVYVLRSTGFQADASPFNKIVVFSLYCISYLASRVVSLPTFYPVFPHEMHTCCTRTLGFVPVLCLVLVCCKMSEKHLSSCKLQSYPHKDAKNYTPPLYLFLTQTFTHFLSFNQFKNTYKHSVSYLHRHGSTVSFTHCLDSAQHTTRIMIIHH